MCGRYYIDPDDPKMKAIVAKALEKKRQEVPMFNFSGGDAFPGMYLPVISLKGPNFMKWGYPSLLSDKKDHINIRSETAGELKTFKEAFARQRCLVPASAYYEWQKTATKKIPYLFSALNDQLFYLAALYNPEASSFAILTRHATPELAVIHQRMPLIVPDSLLQDWLSNSTWVVDKAVDKLKSRIL